MKIRLVAYGIARDFLRSALSSDSGTDAEIELEIRNIRELRAELVRLNPDFAQLRSLSFAVNEEYRAEDFELKENMEVVILPPASGG